MLNTYVCVTDRMIDWIKHGIEKVVPHLETHVHSKTEVNEKTEAPSSTKGSLGFVSASIIMTNVFKLVILRHY